VFQENFRQTTIQHIYDLGTTFASDSLGTSIGTGAKRSLDKIFKANTAYDLGPNTLAYFTFSQGYRAGGANAYPIGTCGYCNPTTYESFGPDSANNFELGIKGTEGRFRYTADIYDIEWNNIQLEVTSNAGTPIIVNGKSARSRGLELEGHYTLNDTITLAGGYAYTEAKITQDFTDGGFSGIAGTPLPGVSHHQVNGNIDYSPPLWPDHEVDLHLDGSYRSGLNNQFEVTLPSFRHISGYALFNAFAQAQITPNVSLQLFAHNLFNAKGISAASSLDPPVSFDTSEFVTRPLTVGLRLVIRR
jgi:iron complex outermembrane receptor protein